MKMKKMFLVAVWGLINVLAYAQTPAFPGAEGFGRYATGGRGGTVYYVNSLEDTNTGNTTTREGTLRWCMTRTGARTILFKVSGTISLNSELKINSGNVTVAGQSAPGDGICIAGFPVTVNADNVIIRFVRFRMGNDKDVNADGSDALGGRYHKNIIIDHCSVSWSTDECCSFYQNTDFTMQWCLISESLNNGGHTKGEHGYGGIWGGFGASFHHNLLAHHKSRVPRLGPGVNSTPTNELTDVRNNVYYNYKGEGCYGGEAMHVNIVNNFYKPGPASNGVSSTKKGRIVAIDKKAADDTDYPVIANVWGTFFIEGNVVDGHAAATNDNWANGVYNQINSKYGITQAEKNALRLSQPLATGIVTTHTAQQAYEQVLLYAGCSHHRDAIDTRIVNDTRTNTATYKGATANLAGIIDSQNDLKPAGAGSDWSAWPALQSLTPPTDADIDGIPDGWLSANAPAGKTAKDLNEEGYTYLEVYLNSLVNEITSNQNAGGIASDIKNQGINPVTVNIYYDGSSNALVVSSDNAIRKVEIYGLTGRIMQRISCESLICRADLSQFSSGVYIIKAYKEDNGIPFVGKIIKNA